MKTINVMQFTRLKKACVELRGKYQIPRAIYDLCMKLNAYSTQDEVNFLKSMSEFYIRVRGFYKKYKELDCAYSKEIYDNYKKLKKGVQNNV